MGDLAGLVPAGVRPWLDRFTIALPRGSTILDLGCGGGEPIARFLIDHGFRIVGVDLSPTAIDLARVRFPRDRWIVGDMRSVALDEQFDGVLAWGSLSALSRTEQAMMGERVSAWMKSDARLLVAIKGSASESDAEGTGFGAAIARRGLVETAHADHDPGCDGAAIWLARTV